jgi:aerobic C4-dicarboxylate transport protein
MVRSVAGLELTHIAGTIVKKPIHKVLYVQVIVAIIIGIALGHFSPDFAIDMKPLGDGFIKLIKMVIGPIIFCTVVTGIAGMEDMKKVGRVGGKALLYFEIVSSFALVLGLIATHVLKPGVGFNIDPATLDGKAVASYAAKAHGQTTVDFLMHIIPDTLSSAFAQGEILQILLIALLFGAVLATAGEKGKVVTNFIDGLSHVLFGIVRIITKLAPIGAFGAMAFTIGKYGIGSLLPMLKLIGTFYLTSIVFVVVVLGIIQHPALCRVHQGRDADRARHELVGSRAAAIDAEARKARLLALGGGPRGADRLLVQPRRHQHLHDDGRAVHRSGH